MTETPGRPPEKQFYDPSELGLDLGDQDDLDLYVQSEGDRILADRLLAVRSLRNSHFQGTISDEAYAQGLNQAYGAIEERQTQLFGSSSGPQ